MTRFYLLTVFYFCFQAMSFAQGADCDSDLYIADAFDINATTAVEYGQSIEVNGNTKTLRMDIYEPVNASMEKRPVIIFAHGGSFIGGSRGSMAGYCQAFAAKGYVTATIDYRLWPIFQGFPDSLNMLDVVVKAVGDMKGAIRYFRQDAATDNLYNIDPDNIIVGGLSAGAIMAVQVGIMEESDNIPEFIRTIIEDNGGIEGESGNEGYPTDVQGIINLSGGLYQVDWLDANDPPILSMHGTSDGTVPYLHGLAAGIMSLNGSGLVDPQAETMGVSQYFISVPGGGHTDIYTDGQYAEYQLDFATNGVEFIKTMVCGDLSSTNQIDVSDQVNVFPNPASDVATIQLASIPSPYNVVVYNALGQMEQMFTNLNEREFYLHKSQVGKGFHSIQLQFEDTRFAPVSMRLIFQ